MLKRLLLIVFLLISAQAHAQSFTNTFGGSAVSPADVAYASYSFSTDLNLFWPQFANGQSKVAARFMNLTASAPGLTVTMPNAMLNSVGYDAIVFNSGSQSVDIVTYGQNDIVSLAPGQTYYLMLSGNTTADGTWVTVQFGVGTSAADASQLAGDGLLAIAGLLNVNLTANIATNDFTLTSAARSRLYVWQGGSGTITLPSASAVGNGFYFMLANNGSGSVTVQPTGGETIDDNSLSAFAQTQSAFIMSNGTDWVTVGKGIQNTFAVTLLNLNVAGSSNVTETSTQAQNIIQQYTGVLTGNINVIVPNTVQLYFANNLTSGSFTLTVKTSGGSGVAINQGTQGILYCDGTNVINAYTASVSGTLSMVPGSAVSPPLSIQGSVATGLFSPAVNAVSFTTNGDETARFISSPGAADYFQLQANNPLIFSAAGTDANVGIQIMPRGTGGIGIGVAPGSDKLDLAGGLGFTTTSASPTNGLYLSGVNSMSLSAGGSAAMSVTTTGSVLGSPTGGYKGAGTLNMTGCFVNGVACITSAGGTGTVTNVTFTGDGTVLSATPSTAVTTTGTLTASLLPANASTVLGNPTGSLTAPVYTTNPSVSSIGSHVFSLTATGSLGVGISGMNEPAVNVIGIGGNGTDALFVTSTSVGVGVSAPAYALDVSGSLHSTGTATLAGISYPGTNGTNTQFLQTNGGGLTSWASPTFAYTGGSVGIGVAQAATYFMWTGVSAAEADIFTLLPAGTFKSMSVLGSGLLPAGETATFTLRKNGVNTAITCTITGPSNICTDSTHTVASAGESYDVMIVTSAATGTLNYNFSLLETIP